MSKPKPEDYGHFYEPYISKIEATSLQYAVSTYADALTQFYLDLPEEKADFRYDVNKWSLKDLLQHVIDTERIMSYRMLRIARNDQIALPGFDEVNYALEANATARTFVSLKEEFNAVRASTKLMIQSFSEAQLCNKGTMSGSNITANAIGFIILGHLKHHQQVITERYL
jgi:hypothetical protein